MKVNDPNLQGPGGLTSTGGSTGVSKPTQTGRSGSAGGPAAPAGDADDAVQLSGLAQTLLSLDEESPERQAQVNSLAQAYAQGNYKADTAATAGGIIDDALKHR